jgi:hypothetical protein
MSSVEQRLKSLEDEVARLKAKAEKPNHDEDPWKRDVDGAFANDPAFLEAMRLGREYREAHRPKTRKSRRRAKR